MRRQLAGLVLSLPLFAGCSNSIDVLQRADPVYDFETHRSYAWTGQAPGDALPKEAPEPDVLDAEIRAAVDAELLDKGYHATDPPDLLVTYRVHVVDRVSTSDDPPPASWDPSTDINKWAYTAFILDVYDAKTQDRVWRGAAMTDIRRGKGRKRVEEVVGRLMQEFPPKR